MVTPPENPGLVAALQGIRGVLTREAASRFYAELNKATLLLAQLDKPPESETGVTQGPTQLAFLTTVGPDGKVWLVAFTDMEHLRVRFPNAKGWAAFPSKAIAEMVLNDPAAPGLVLNPGPDNGGAQPVERKGLEAVALGKAPPGF